MALVTVSGYPCSGKSRRVEQLRNYLESRISDPSSESNNLPPLKVVVISDDSLGLTRDAYNGSFTQLIQSFLRLNRPQSQIVARRNLLVQLYSQQCSD